MALLMLDGIDKYGPANSVSANVIALLTQGEWTSASGGATIVAPLSATGFALSLSGGSTVSRTLAANYSRLIGGIRFSSNLANVVGVQFNDGGTAQASIAINAAGTLSVKNGVYSTGTVLGTSSVSVTAGTTHYLEWDVSFANSAASFQLWLDGVSCLTGSGDTTGTANNYANGISLGGFSSGTVIYDDFYLLDATGPAPLNAPLLTSPRIETQFPVSDGVVQFAVGAAVLGSTLPRIAGNAYAASANTLYLVPLTPTTNCTITSIGFLCGTGNATVQLRPVLYADNAGAPGTLLSSGATSVGATTGVIKTLPLTTGQSLTAGTRYWLGVMNDVSFTNGYAGLDSSAVGRFASATFASGAPGTAPATTGGQNTAVVFGVVTPPGNFYSCAQNPSQGSLSYVYDATVGHEDLYSFPALSVVPSAIYATAVKASASKSDAGAKTLSIRQKSGSTDSSGGAQAPGTSFAWLTSLFPTDPNGGGAWTKAALDAAQGGVRVES